MAEKLLEVKNLRTEFKRDKTWVTAVNNVSFSIQPGEILGLVGESGCGKSVTSLSVMGLLARNSKISNGEYILLLSVLLYALSAWLFRLFWELQQRSWMTPARKPIFRWDQLPMQFL